MNILMVVTGSISAYLYEKIYNKLSKNNEVEILFTNSAIDVINNSKHCKSNMSNYPMTIKEESQLYFETGKVKHIDLINWADKVVVAPCTANTLNKMNYGIADDFITSTLLAFLGTYKPVYIAPAMNTNMYNNHAVKRSINDLNQYKHIHFIYPTVKELACGDNGIGALADIDSICNIVDENCWSHPLASWNNDLTNYPADDLSKEFSEYLPKFNEPGSFGFVRKYDIHTGVDIYCKKREKVCAVEDGEVVDTGIFTGKSVGSNWWNTTYYVVIKGSSGYVLYGEIEFPIEMKIGKKIKKGDFVGYVEAVINEDKIRPLIRNHSNYMLHMELYKEYNKPVVWNHGEKRDKNLLDPTPYLHNIF